MQIVSGNLVSSRIHFEAPPANTVPGHMKTFTQWFNNTNSDYSQMALTRAGIAHLWFLTIHPFEDGNGRVARALSEHSLARSLGTPSLIALASTIESDRKRYYTELEKTNTTLEITSWLVWFAGTILTAQAKSHAQVLFLIEKAKLLNRVDPHINERQRKVLLRMLSEGPKGFDGGLSAENYIRIAKTSASTATRDLQELVALKALNRTGQRKGTRYFLPFSST